jgi:metal-responsive CopG/Arc/MetJ family transcriptional regulator
MKTAISIPDSLFNDAEVTAKQLGLARSQLYVKAIKEFIEHHNKEKITEKLNKLYEKQNNSENALIDVGIDSLRKATENDTW